MLVAMNVAPEVIDGTFRVSLCRNTTAEEVDKLVSVIESELLPRVK